MKRRSTRRRLHAGHLSFNPDGSYSVRTVAPIGYTIPMDRPMGELMSKTKVSHMRPAHVHFCIAAPGTRA